MNEEVGVKLVEVFFPFLSIVVGLRRTEGLDIGMEVARPLSRPLGCVDHEN